MLGKVERLVGELRHSGTKTQVAGLMGMTNTVFDTFTRTFRPSAALREPMWSIAVSGVCARTEKRAERLGPT